jgi:hypothetical protein
MRLYLALITAFIAAGAAAQEAPQKPLPPISPDRPDQTDSPDTVVPGHIQVETGYQFTHTGTARLHELGQVLFRIPASSRFEWRLGLNSFAWMEDSGVRQSGFEDVTPAFKYRFFDGSEKFNLAKPALAVEAGATVPSGSSAFRENSVQPFASLLASWNLDEQDQLGVAFGIASPSNNGEHFTELSASASFNHQLSARVAGFLETYGFFPTTSQQPAQSYVDTGIQYLVNNNTMLDARIGFGMNSVRPDMFVGAGISYRW